jgi:glycosyltransferase involved in cell wall biosynthesis
MSAATTSADSSERYDDWPSEASPSRGRSGVVMHASFNDETSFAEENRSLSVRLAQHQLPVQIVPTCGQRERIQATARRDFQYRFHERLDLGESVLFQSGDPVNWNLDLYGSWRVGRTVFGTDRIPDGWAERCNAVDELWLPSEFHREIFVASGVERSKVRIIPCAVDSKVFRPAQTTRRDSSERSFRFLAVADAILASGIDTLVRAFIEEFSPHDNLSLIIHTVRNPCGSAFIDFEAELLFLIEKTCGRKLEDVPKITLLKGAISASERSRLYASSDAFVQPVRAEATGRYCLEALACQLPVIATDWGPLNGFLTERNSFPLEMARLSFARPDENEWVAGHRWVAPNADLVKHQMRAVFSDPTEAARRAEQGRRDVLRRFEWRAVLPEWIRNFRRLLE